jgi:hypothetical protein
LLSPSVVEQHRASTVISKSIVTILREEGGEEGRAQQMRQWCQKRQGCLQERECDPCTSQRP